MRIISAGLAALALSACATPRERIADALVSYGIPSNEAHCVGARLEDRLSLKQLQQLSRLARAYREADPDPKALTANDLLRIASHVEDVRVPIEVGKAAANCGIFPSGPMGMIALLSER